MTQDPKIIEHWIDVINTEARDLTKWEEDFMESITDFFERTGRLSDKQEEILERIYAERTS